MPTFYCYSRCSTCKKAQKWLDDHQVAYDQQDLVAEPPAKELFVKWLTEHQDLGLRYFFNTSGQHYREQKLKDKLPTMTIDGDCSKRPLMVERSQLTCGCEEDVYEQTWR